MIAKFTSRFMKGGETMKPNWKVIGILATIAGGVLSLISNKVEEEKMKVEVRKTVDEVLAERDNEEESE